MIFINHPVFLPDILNRKQNFSVIKKQPNQNILNNELKSTNKICLRDESKSSKYIVINHLLHFNLVPRL